jgi:hypothetical protein
MNLVGLPGKIKGNVCSPERMSLKQKYWRLA